MNKIFSGKKFNKEKFIDFFDRKGFYIILTICIAVIAATALFVNREPADPDGSSISDDGPGDTELSGDLEDDDEDDDLEASSNLDNETDDNADGDADPTNGSENTDGTVTNANEESSGDSDPASSDNAVTIELSVPVFGDISLDYAMDKLVYSKTLEDWRTHSGLDISSSRGTAVKAAADGYVYQIKNDPRFGITIILSHSDGVKTVYSNLASGEYVVTNQNVKKDDVIGSIGNTALFETAEPAHLHFEVLVNDEYVDPKDYLPD